MAKENEFKVKLFKNVNESWSGTAYFTNSDNSKTYCITVSAMPGEKANTAKAYVKEQLAESVTKFLSEHLGWKRIERDECEKIDRAIHGY